MKTIASFAYGAAIATTITLLTGYAHHTEMLEETKRETNANCVAHYRAMLSETHALYQAKPERCLEIETSDMTARELLWHFQSLCDSNGIEVQTHDYP